MTAVPDKGWHVGDYGRLGWAETAVKAVAFAIAFVALAHALDRELARPHGIHVFELVLLGVAELGLILAVGDRLIERELMRWASLRGQRRAPGHAFRAARRSRDRACCSRCSARSCSPAR